MSFYIVPLALGDFAPLFELDDAALQARGAKRYVAEQRPGFPCRVILQDAELGERVNLVTFMNQPANTPYQSTGPIFVRESASQAAPGRGEVPELLRLRLLSIRAFDDDGLMVDADVTDGRELEATIARLFSIARVRYLHVHFARPGCYACRIERA